MNWLLLKHKLYFLGKVIIAPMFRNQMCVWEASTPSVYLEGSFFFPDVRSFITWLHIFPEIFVYPSTYVYISFFTFIFLLINFRPFIFYIFLSGKEGLCSFQQVQSIPVYPCTEISLTSLFFWTCGCFLF